jgi:hypothetical protein
VASVDDVAGQVSAAIDQASKCRDALAQADDLVEDAHDLLAATLRGVRYADLASDVEQTLAGFSDARADMRALFRTLDAGRASAERYLAKLRGGGTPEPHPDAQRPAQPPQQPSPASPPAQPPSARQAEPDDPPAIAPERIEQLRRELPPPVVPNTGQKTHGRWIGPDGTVREIVSERDAGSVLVEQQLAAKGLHRKITRAGDVEMKVAADMAANGIKHATVVINYVPCLRHEVACVKWMHRFGGPIMSVV